jgi:FXSXX-COOH protein
LRTALTSQAEVVADDLQKGWSEVENESSTVNETLDVSGYRLADLIENRDPALARAIERLVAELDRPIENVSQWSSFLRPSRDPGRPA